MSRFIAERLLASKEIVEVYLHLADFQEYREAIKVHPIPGVVRFMDGYGRFVRSPEKSTADYCEEIYGTAQGNLREFENMSRPNSPPFLIVWNGDEFPALLVYCYESEWRAMR